MSTDRTVPACSGGLDTSAAIGWTAGAPYGASTVAVRRDRAARVLAAQ